MLAYTNYHRQLLFVLTTILVGLFSANSSAQEQSPEMEYVCELRVTCGPSYEVGATAHGRRVVIPITGGTFEGPAMRGEVLAGGADYQLVDGMRQRAELEAIYNIRTDDGVNIHVRNCGISCWKPDGLYFRTAPRFEAPQDSPYAWLNEAIFVCTPQAMPGYTSLKVWKIK